MINAGTIAEDLTKMGDIIVAARDLVADGQLINLKPLESEIGRIGKELAGINAVDAERIKPVLLSLLDELDRLAGDMRARQADVESQLRSLSTHASAARAYQAPPGAGTGRK